MHIPDRSTFDWSEAYQVKWLDIQSTLGHFRPMTKTEFKQARLDLKLSQPALAARLGMSERQVCRYEHGDRTIPKPVEIAVKHFLLMAQIAG